MNSIMKRSAILILSAVVALVFMVIPQTQNSYADLGWPAKLDKKITVLTGGGYKYYVFNNTNGRGKIKSMKTSNKKVVALNKNGKSSFIAKKPGTATLTVKVKKKGKTSKFKCKVTVKKYNNPLAKFTFGQKDITAKFNKNPQIFYSSDLQQALVDIQPKAGWTVKKLQYFRYSDDTDAEVTKSIKNGDVVKFIRKEGEIEGIEFRLFNKKDNLTIEYVMELDQD